MKIFKLTLFLGIVGLLSGLLMATTNSFTKDKIVQNKIDERNRSFKKVYKKDVIATDLKISQGTIKTIYEIKENETIIGYVYNVNPRGYAGEIDSLFSLDKDGNYLSYDVLSYNETPGIGSKIKDAPFKESIQKKNVEDEKIDYISGATVSSRAVDSAFKEVNIHFKENFK